MGLNEYKLTRWSRLVKVRDKGLCYMCENKHIIYEMNSHHIYPKGDPYYVDRAYDLDNGITLCWRCHRKIVHISWENWRKFVAMFRNRMRNREIRTFNEENQNRI